MKNNRLFQMLYLLLEKNSMTAPELANILEVSVRTVYRDVEALSMAGVPIYASVGKGGGISLLPGYTFDKSLLSDEEQDNLLFAVQSLQAADQQVEILLTKLGSIFQKPRVDWIVVDFSRWGLYRKDTKKFDLIKHAILGRQVLTITYCGTSGAHTVRKIHPLRLIFKGKNWYLQAYCLQANDFRLFKMNRILTFIPTGSCFTRDYLEDIPPLEIDAPPQSTTHMKLRFSPRMAFRLYDEFNVEDVVHEPDGSLLVDIVFPMDDWVVSYLFFFGTEVEILEPLTLKIALRAHAEKIAAHYKT